MPELILKDRVSQGASFTRNPQVLKVQYGNGYTQRAKDGRNSLREEGTVPYDNLTQTEMEQIVAFFDGLAGVDTFTWKPPGASVVKKWIQKGSLAVTPKSGGLYSIRVPIERVFDIGPV